MDFLIFLHEEFNKESRKKRKAVKLKKQKNQNKCNIKQEILCGKTQIYNFYSYP